MHMKKWTAAAIGAVLAVGADGGAPSALLRRGWNRNSLPAGTEIIVDAFRARDGDTRASAAEIRFPNGRELSLGNPTTEAVAAAAARARD